MRILLIGGSGLISTAITRFLLERGADDLTLYNRGKTELRLPYGVKVLTGDRTDFAAFEAQMADAGKFDCVIDMCCYRPDEAESVVHAFSGRIGQYIFTSTVDVYTKPAVHYPITEQAERNPSPAFTYAYHKAACEEVIQAAHNNSDFLVTIIRPAYTYGESRGILHSLGGRTTYVDRIRQGKPIIVHNDGQSLWSSCHIDDVAHAFVQAVGNTHTYGQAYHVAGEEILTWDQYHQQVAAALGAPAPTLVHIPAALLARAVPKLGAWAELNFQYNNVFDNQAAHRDLNFQYTIPWKQGVQRTVAWLDAHDRVEAWDNEPAYDRILTAWAAHGEGMVAALADLR
ncbi:MAG: NAD-dependent epimerase/dehydratase family protein [Caldilineaceae bacterium]|nr:NAD-dependent epimerase/dehydratase family protein [Caldilineaceae bacterium]